MTDGCLVYNVQTMKWFTVESNLLILPIANTSKQSTAVHHLTQTSRHNNM